MGAGHTFMSRLINGRPFRGRAARRLFRVSLFLILFGVILLQTVLFTPMDLESDRAVNRVQAIDPKLIIKEIDGDRPFLAPSVPRSRIPEYRVNQFNYISNNSGRRDWKLQAKEADFYNKVNIVHGKVVVAQLYDSSGHITIVTGDEAQYMTDGKDLEIFGHVISRFPDGMIVESEYMQYLADKKIMSVPDTQKVQGQSYNDTRTQQIAFESLGMDYHMDQANIFLHKEVHFQMAKVKKGPKEDTSVIQSDRCTIDRTASEAHFVMREDRPDQKRFVLTEQPDLFVKSRTLDLDYGDYANVIHNMTAKEDVYIEERNDEGIKRTATGGQADFDAQKNIIVLTKYPQVYQDNDTVTGDVIIVYRETDVIQVEHSNAFSEGQKSKPAAPAKNVAGD